MWKRWKSACAWKQRQPKHSGFNLASPRQMKAFRELKYFEQKAPKCFAGFGQPQTMKGFYLIDELAMTDGLLARTRVFWRIIMKCVLRVFHISGHAVLRLSRIPLSRDFCDAITSQWSFVQLFF